MSDYLLSDLLRQWYFIYKRDLPWRQTRDPYRIWISEIILQQTRVQQGLDYYNRFIERFPDFQTLASAPLDEVLKYWQGLGYYSRARNLHAAACQIKSTFGDVFPKNYADILSLKGVGSYTAAAIASFAYDLPYAVLDGNVYRVLARLTALDTPIDSTAGKKVFQELADQLLDPEQAAIHNQAMMELGALICTPTSPDCVNCPLQNHCEASAKGIQTAFPVKQGKTKVRDRWFHYFFIVENGYTYLHQRTKKDIWSHLYEFPLIETSLKTDFAELQSSDLFQQLFAGQKKLDLSPLLIGKKHILSHQRIHADFYKVELSAPLPCNDHFIRIPIADLERYPVSRLTHICIEQL